jgi:methylated-DNA-[protein]-cysteine S-methyltransferase
MAKTIIRTPYGSILVEADQNGITRVELNPRASEKPSGSSAVLRKTEKYFKEYFKGKDQKTMPALELKTGTGFDRKVWKAMRRIPYGETRSYAWVAKQAGKPKACRAAGNAVGRNPIPVIIPCHRVIKSDGTIGGFSSGLKWKKFLMRIEKIKPLF